MFDNSSLKITLFCLVKDTHLVQEPTSSDQLARSYARGTFGGR